jgi:hypothetical protein
MASLERRLAAGTLLAGACRPHEVAWFAAEMAHCETLSANAAVRVPHTAAEMSAWAAYAGYDTYILTAGLALRLCVVTAQALLNPVAPEATAVAGSMFVERAFDMMQLPTGSANLMQLRTGAAHMFETTLVRNAQIFIEERPSFCTTSGNEWQARILAAWRRLQSSGVLQRRGILQGMGAITAQTTHQRAAAAATAAARGLHFCALHACGAQEVHASQFKRCSACSGVVYCCKEHQVQDWPAHKAACRAARKAAEQAAEEASGA